ncbi:MAG: histidine kinase [Calditrichaceae bacterium]
MISTVYRNHQYFFNLLLFNFIWSAIRIIQWAEIQPERIEFNIKYIAIEFLIIVFICQLMIILFKLSDNIEFPIMHFVNFIVFPIAASVLLFVTAYAVKYIIWPNGIIYDFSFSQIKSSGYYYIFFFIMITGILYATRFRIDYFKQKEVAQISEALAKETRLKMLRYQINPHFLFNILNSLHALVDENRELAKKLIINLAEYYRSTLDKHVQEHDIDREISIIKKYLEIQKIRFENNLQYDISVDSRTGKIKIPSFIIHLLVENAVKYGLKGNEKKLIINLNISLENGTLNILVINSGKLQSKEQNKAVEGNGTGSGIENVTSRLKLFYQDNFRFAIKEEHNSVIAKIEIMMDRI